MKKSDLSIRFTVPHTPQEVFAAINQVDRWWSAGIQGSSARVGDEFSYRHKGLHWSKQKVTEMVENRRVVWHVTDGELTFVQDRGEWKDTEIVFEISRKGDATEVMLTHVGLTPNVECFQACNRGWSHYFGESLRQLILSGAGSPDPTEFSQEPA